MPVVCICGRLYSCQRVFYISRSRRMWNCMICRNRVLETECTSLIVGWATCSGSCSVRYSGSPQRYILTAYGLKIYTIQTSMHWLSHIWHTQRPVSLFVLSFITYRPNNVLYYFTVNWNFSFTVLAICGTYMNAHMFHMWVVYQPGQLLHVASRFLCLQHSHSYCMLYESDFTN